MTKMVKGYKIFFWVYCFLQMDSVYGLQTWHGRQGIKKKGDKACLVSTDVGGGWCGFICQILHSESWFLHYKSWALATFILFLVSLLH